MAQRLPESERQVALFELYQEKSAAEVDDTLWEHWYDHYHEIILLPKEPGFMWHIENGLNFNLQTAALYVPISATVVPRVRRWWCILPACIWTLLLLLELYYKLKQFLNRWSTYSAQITYLSNHVINKSNS